MRVPWYMWAAGAGLALLAFSRKARAADAPAEKGSGLGSVLPADTRGSAGGARSFDAGTVSPRLPASLTPDGSRAAEVLAVARGIKSAVIAATGPATYVAPDVATELGRPDHVGWLGSRYFGGSEGAIPRDGYFGRNTYPTGGRRV